MTDLDGDTRPPARLSKPQQSQKKTTPTTRVAKVHTARANVHQPVVTASQKGTTYSSALPSEGWT